MAIGNGSGSNPGRLINGTSRSDRLIGGAADDTINGLGGNDFIDAGAGNDCVDGGTGTDIILGGAGNDTLDGGSGWDALDGGTGNDTLIYRRASNTGDLDAYIGGRGVDTIRMMLTAAEWARADVKADLARYVSFLQGHVGSNGEADNAVFAFSTSGLLASGFERVEIYVDGVLVTPGGDTTPPPAPSVSLAAASDTGAAGDRLTSDTTPTLTGTAEAGATVTVVRNGTAIGTTQASAAGQWSFTTLALGEGPHSFTATATDAAGNASVVSAALSVTIDSVAPTAPVLDLATADDTGTSNTDDLTRNANVSVTVAAETGSTVRLGAQSAIAIGGVATFSVVLVEGLNMLSATTTDAAGNVSTADTLAITRDSTADQGGDLAVTIADAQINAAEKGAVSYTVAGLDAGATATITFTSSGGGTVTRTVTTNGTATADLSALPDGTVTAAIVAGDPAGNSATGAAGSAVIDTAAPDAPTIDLTSADDTGSSNFDNLTRNATVSVSIAAETGGTVRLGTQAAIAIGGVATFSVVLVEGLNTLSATTTDAAGNVSAAGTLAITRDSTADQGGDLAVTIADAQINAAEKGSVSYTVTGLDADATATITFSSSGGGTVTRTVTANGTATADLSSLADGTVTAAIVAGDPAGNSAVGAEGTALIDAAAPDAPVIDLTSADDTGSSNFDNLTSDGTVNVTVAAESGSTVRLGAQSAIAIGGVATFGVALGEGLNALSATASDAAGNTSIAGTLTITRDSIAPSAPSIMLAPSSDTGVLGDFITSDTTPTLSGVAESGVVVDIRDSATLIGNATASATSGVWSFTTGELAAGAHAFTATATDAAGNVSTAAPLGVTIETTTPTTIAFALAESDEASAPGVNTTAASIVALVGVTDPGAAVAIAGGPATIADNLGAFRLTDVALSLGTQTITLTVTPVGGTAVSASLALERVAAPVGGNEVITWIREALLAIADESAAPTYASRALAMESLAVYNVVAAINGTPGYLFGGDAPAGASVDAAVARAAHDVLEALFPAQKGDLDAALLRSLLAIADGASENDGVALGQQVASQILDQRADDGWNTVVNDVGSNQVGQWQPTPSLYAPGLDPQWANLDTFVLASPAQFRPTAPPALNSQQFVDAFNEVASLGASDSTTRTADQTQIARFWAGGVGTVTPPGMWNNIALTLADSRDIGTSETARMFATLNVALADSGITAWNTKYAYDFWRPVTAIRDAADLANPALVADRDWLPLIPTPPFPEYISGHSTYSAAAATVLGDFFGADTDFTLRSGTVDRSFTSFWDAANEAGVSRIYGGIHFSFSNTAGLQVGQDVGNWALDYFDTTTDTIAPSIRIDQDSGFVTGSAPTITGNVLDNLSGVERVTFTLNDSAPGVLSLNADGSFALPTATLLAGVTDGPQRLAIYATDAAGNATSIDTFAFTLATADPTITLAASGVQPGETISAGERLVGSIGLVAGNSLTSLAVSFDGGAQQAIAFSPELTFDQALDLRTVSAGAHTLTLAATDAAGNVATQVLNVVVPTLPFTVTDITPAANEMMIGVTTRPMVTFSRPVDPLSLTSSSFYATDATGAALPATIVPFVDGLGAWLLFTDALPGSSAITLHLEGNEIRSVDGSFLDAAGTGAAGGSTLLDVFTTVSRDSVPGTVITGIVVDPGLDNEMMTPDDVIAGPGGLTDFAHDTWRHPLEGVKVYILGQEDRFVLTDATGRFTLTDVPVGNVKIAVDGRTATNTPAGTFFPEMVMDSNIRPGVVNTVMGSMGPVDAQLANADNPAVYLPRLDNTMLVTLNTTGTTVVHAVGAQNNTLTGDQLALIRLEVAPGSLIDENGNPVVGAQVGLSPVPPSMVMDMLPPGVLQHSFDITIQAPGGAVFTTPAELTLPNVFGLAPGEKSYVMSFDHTSGRLVINGTATVSADGLTITTDPGSGIMAPGWHGVAPRGSMGEGEISTRCPPTHEPIANFGDLEGAALNVAGHVGTLNDLAGGKLLGESRIVQGVQNVAALRADSNQTLDTLTQLHTAWYAGDTGGYGAPDGWYYATMGLKLLGDVSKTVIDAGAAATDYIPGADKTPLAKVLKGGQKLITAGETLGTWTSGGSVFQPIKDFEAKVEQQIAQNQVNAHWTPPPDALEPAARAKLNQAIDTAVANDTARTPFINEVVNQTRTLVDFFSTWNESLPFGGKDIPSVVRPDGSSDVGNAASRAANAAASAAEFGTALDDLDAIIRALEAYFDAVAHDTGMPISAPINEGTGGGSGEPDAPPPSVIDEIVIEYGPTFCAVLENLDTGDQQRTKFDPSQGYNQFLEADTHYKLTVYDPVSKEVGQVIFISNGTGIATHIPTISMLPDPSLIGAGGLSAIAAYVLGINPNIADNFVPGIADGTALATGLADNPALANVTGIVGAVALQGDAEAVIVESRGANSAIQTAYVATGDYGLGIVDVTNPRIPVSLSQLDLSGYATDVAYDRQNDLAVVALGTGIAVVDVSAPAASRLLHTIDEPVTQVEIVDGTLYYVADGLVNAYDLASRTIESAALLDEAFPATGMANDGSHLYVFQAIAGGRGRLTVLDIADGSPSVTGALEVPFTMVQSFGGQRPIVVSDNIVYVTAVSGYGTIDVSNPAAPTLISDVDANNLGVYGFALNGSGRAVGVGRFIINNATETFVDVIRTTNPNDTAAVTNRIILPTTATPLDVAIAGGNAFIGTTDGLLAVQYLTPDRLGVAPTVTVTTPVVDIDPSRPGIQVREGSSINLGVRVIDDVQVRSVELLENGRSVATDLSVPISVGTALPTIAENGGSNVTLQVRATDTGGNVGLATAINVELVADVRPFNLINVTPDFLATTSTQARTVSYLFSKPLDPETVGVANFILKDALGTIIPATGIALLDDGTRVTITYEALGVGHYIGTVRATQIRDLAGNTLDVIDYVGPADFTVQDYGNVWTGGAVGRWSIPTNWSQGSIPDAADSVLVEVPTGGEVLYDVSLGSGDHLGDLTVTGGGVLHVETAPFSGRSIGTTGLANAATIHLDAVTSLDLTGNIHNTGQIELGSTNSPVPFSLTGGSAQMSLQGADIRLTGGGVIELEAASLANRPRVNVYSLGTEYDGIVGTSISSRVTNVDNTIRGGGTFGGLGIIVNEAAGVIESATNERLTLDAYHFNTIGSFGSFTSSELIDNRGTIRAVANSTLEIKNADVVNSGVLRADGLNSLLLLNNFVSVTGGTIDAIGAGDFGVGAHVFLENATLKDTTLDVSQGAGAFGRKTVTLDDVTLFGLFQHQPQDSSGGLLKLKGAIENHGQIQVISDASRPMGVELLGDTTFTGGGSFVFSTDGTDLTFKSADVEYPPHNDGDPVPPMPAPVVVTNVDNVLVWSGLIQATTGSRAFIDENLDTVLRPQTAPIEIVNASAGFIMSGGQQLTFDGVDITNGGRILALSGSPLSLHNATVTNTYQQDNGAGGFTTVPGNLEAFQGSVLRLDNATVLGGRIGAVETGSAIEIANEQQGPLQGAALRDLTSTYVAEGGTLRIMSGASLEMSHSSSPTISVILDGTLDIQSSDGLGGRVKFDGLGGDFLSLHSTTGTGTLQLETIDTSGTRSVLEGNGGASVLQLFDVDIVGDGVIDTGFVSILGSTDLRAAAGGELTIDAAVQIFTGDSLIDRGVGVTAFNGTVDNNGAMIADGFGDSFVFNDVLVNDGSFEARGGAIVTFNAQATGGSDFELEDDSAFVFNGSFDGRVAFNDIEAPGNGRVVISDTVGFAGHFATFKTGDVIDLLTIDFATAAIDFEGFDGSVTTIILGDGGDGATLRFEGDYVGRLQIVAAEAGAGSWLTYV